MRLKEPVKYKEDRVRAHLARAAEAEVEGFALLWTKACGLESSQTGYEASCEQKVIEFDFCSFLILGQG